MRIMKVLMLTFFVLMFMGGLCNDLSFGSDAKPYFLFGDSQIYQPELSGFAGQLKMKNLTPKYAYRKEIQSDHKSYRIILTLLAPKIQEQINEYYKNKLTESPTFAPYLDGNKLEVIYNSSGIDVKVTVIPYVGPHISVGKELIEFSIDNAGRVKTVKYNHIEEYTLPPNWEYLIK